MKRTFFVGLLTAAALCLPVQAARPASLQVDGGRLETPVYVEEGTAYAPLRELLEALGIEGAWLSRFPRELSGGELQRFCVARALLSGAPFLICDEISTMLDVITQAQIWNVVLAEAERRNMGLIAVTHNRRLAERIANRMYELS